MHQEVSVNAGSTKDNIELDDSGKVVVSHIAVASCEHHLNLAMQL